MCTPCALHRQPAAQPRTHTHAHVHASMSACASMRMCCRPQTTHEPHNGRRCGRSPVDLACQRLAVLHHLHHKGQLAPREHHLSGRACPVGSWRRRVVGPWVAGRAAGRQRAVRRGAAEWGVCVAGGGGSREDWVVRSSTTPPRADRPCQGCVKQGRVDPFTHPPTHPPTHPHTPHTCVNAHPIVLVAIHGIRRPHAASRPCVARQPARPASPSAPAPPAHLQRPCWGSGPPPSSWRRRGGCTL